jgi:hypothetical protein
VVDVLKSKLESVEWAKIGLNEPPVSSQIEILDTSLSKSNEDNQISILNNPHLVTSTSSNNQINQINTVTDEVSNGYVIVKQKLINNANNQPQEQHKQTVNTKSISAQQNYNTNKSQKIDLGNLNDTKAVTNKNNTLSHHTRSSQNNNHNLDDSVSSYDSSLGIVLNIDNLDRDTGDFKYQRRPLFEWLARWLKYFYLNLENNFFLIRNAIK